MQYSVVAVMFMSVIHGQRVGDPHVYTSPQAVEVFKGADTNHDGKLERTEVDHLLQPFDVNHDGAVTFSEFSAGWRGKNLGSLVAGAQLFRHLDTGNTGEVTLTDMNRIFGILDSNGDGHVSKDEFVNTWVKFEQ